MWVEHARLGDYTQSTPTVTVLRGIPSGREGAAATVRYMRDFVHASLRNTDQTVRNLALELVRNLPARNWRKEIEALHAFVRDRIRYVRDPQGVELVQSPEKTLEFGQGDCDDKSTLLAALLASIDHPSRFIAVGLNGGPLSHVLVEAKVGNDWLPLETIINKPPGWFPPGVTSRYYLKV